VKTLLPAPLFHIQLQDMERKQFMQRVSDQFQVAKVVALIGPRQSGKTTLARRFASVW
jgi:predicted AAA+ superfamily ATPase